MGKLTNHEKLRICSMGKVFSVTAVFTNDEDANAYMAKHKDEGVIAVIQGVVFLANVYDGGQRYTLSKGSA